MRSRTLPIAAAVSLMAALLLWAAFGYLVLKVIDARTLFAAEIVDAAQNEERARTAQRLRALVRDSEAERNVLEDLARTDVLVAAKAIEAAGKAAGTATVVKGANNVPLNGVSKSQTAKDLRAVEMLVDVDGRFQSILHAIELFEALPFLSSIKSIEIDERSIAGKNAANVWHMALRIRIITTSPVGI